MTSLAVDSEARTLEATGESAANGSFLAFLPGPVGRGPETTGRGLEVSTWQSAPGGAYVLGLLRADSWRVAIAPGG